MSQMKALVDKLLTNVSQAYVPEGFVSEMVLPSLKVVQSSGKIGKYGNAHLRIISSLMGGKGQAKRVEIRQYSSDAYFIESHGLEDVIAIEEYDNVEAPFNIESDVTMQLTTLLWMSKEKALADTLTNASIITQNTTLAGVTQWSDYTNSDPIGDIRTAKKTIRDNSGARADLILMDYDTAEVLRYHPKILRNLGFADNRAGQLTNEDLSKAFGVKRFMVADVVYNSAKEGQSDSLSPLWGKDVVIAACPESPNKLQKSLGYYVTKSSEGARKVYKQNVINPPDAKSIIVKDSYDMVLTDVKCAYLIKAAIA